jgi:hypothetical protein
MEMKGNLHWMSCAETEMWNEFQSSSPVDQTESERNLKTWNCHIQKANSESGYRYSFSRMGMGYEVLSSDRTNAKLTWQNPGWSYVTQHIVTRHQQSDEYDFPDKCGRFEGFSLNDAGIVSENFPQIISSQSDDSLSIGFRPSKRRETVKRGEKTDSAQRGQIKNSL